jgi:hypothetical protein
MTYSPGYQSAPPQQYGAPTQQFDRAPEAAGPVGPSKLPLYLSIAVVVLGFAVYLSAFAPVFGGVGAATPTFFLVIAPLLAGLFAGVSLLPKQDDKSAAAAVLAVLGFLLLILTVLGDGPTIDWGFYLFIAFTVLQAIVAVAKLLLDAGIITAPAPKPKYEQPAYGQYGPPAGYYGQPPQGGQGPQQRPGGYAPQYGGYQGGGSPSTGGFPALGQQGASHGGPQGAPHNAPYGGPHNDSQNGPPTPPTGFPAFGNPQAQSSAPTVVSGQPGVPDDAQTQQQPSQQSAPPPS